MVTKDMRKLVAKAIKAKKRSDAEQAKRVNGIPFASVIEGIKVIEMATWCDVEVPYWKKLSPEKLEARLFTWCQRNKAHYFKRNLKDFESMETAINVSVNETKGLNREVVVIDIVS